MFGKRKHRTFNYKPRFSEGNQEQDILEEDIKTDFRAKWRQQSGHKVKMKGALPVKTLILILVLLLICMYLLEKKYM